MQVSCLAIAVLGLFVAMATSLQLPGSKKLPKKKSFSKPEASTDSLYNFNVVLKRLEVHQQFFGNYVGDRTDARVQMYNDSMPVIDGKLELLKDLPANMKIKIIGYTFSESNQWLMMFDQGWHDYCKFAEDNVSFMKNIYKATDFDECPIKKGLYTATNLVIDEKGFPPGLPESLFRIDAKFAVNGEEIGGASFYAEIVHVDEDDD